MKKVLLTVLAVVIVLGLFAAVGFTGYRFGYVQGIQATASGQTPELRPFDGMGPNRMPIPGFGDRFDRDFDRGFGPGGFPMRGFGFFAPLRFLGQILLFVLIVGIIYWLFTRSGWRLTRTVQTAETPPPVKTEVKE